MTSCNILAIVAIFTVVPLGNHGPPFLTVHAVHSNWLLHLLLLARW